MARYHCPYVSNGVSYVCEIEASSASEAAERMNALGWAPNCGPAGTPKRHWSMPSVNEAAMTLVLACVLGAAAMLIGTFDSEPQLVAAFSDMKTN